jgi:hypothetical protein
MGILDSRSLTYYNGAPNVKRNKQSPGSSVGRALH